MNLSFGSSHRGSAQRGEETRARILAAAIETFASVGYEAAHTRLLAERAGVKLPAIPYYFGSKEGLFRAVIEAIAAKVAERMAPAAEAAQAALADTGASRDRLLAPLMALLDTFIETMLGGDFPTSWRLIVSRAEIENLDSLDALRDCMVRTMIDPTKSLLARILGQDENDEHSWLRAIAILGQINIFCKPLVCRGLGWSDYNAERIGAVQATVREHVVAILASSKEAQR